MPAKYLIIGLGNIGPQYQLTRHNIGFLILDRLADKHEVEFEPSRLAFKAEIKHKGRTLYLIKPSTYMNLSGKAVRYWLGELNIPKENSLTVVDDIALPYGKLRMRRKGSSLGHNGLRNIAELIDSEEYPRLKFGIGNNYPKGKQVEYVLSNFSRTELENLPILMDKAVESIGNFSTIGLVKTMNMVNG